MMSQPINELRKRTTHDLRVAHVVRSAVEKIKRVHELEVLIQAVHQRKEFNERCVSVAVRSVRVSMCCVRMRVAVRCVRVSVRVLWVRMRIEFAKDRNVTFVKTSVFIYLLLFFYE